MDYEFATHYSDSLIKSDFCDILTEIDQPIILKEYNDKLPKAYDIILNEDVNIYKYLNDEEFPIILKVNENHYAFDRFNLLKIMNNLSNRTKIGENFYFKTPWRHLIDEDSINSLLYLDFSFYEIIETETLINNQKLYTFKEFTCKSYIKKYLNNERFKLFGCCSK
jgi:hypothetical protein